MTVRPFSRTCEAVQFTKALHTLKIMRGGSVHQSPSHTESHAYRFGSQKPVYPAQATLPQESDQLRLHHHLALNATKATTSGAQFLTLTSLSTLHRPRCLRSQISLGYIAIRHKRHQGHSARSPVAHLDEPIYPAQATLP